MQRIMPRELRDRRDFFRHDTDSSVLHEMNLARTSKDPCVKPHACAKQIANRGCAVCGFAPRVAPDCDSHHMLSTVTPAQLLERQQLAGDCAGGNRRRTGEPYLPRPGSPGKIAVDRT